MWITSERNAREHIRIRQAIILLLLAKTKIRSVKSVTRRDTQQIVAQNRNARVVEVHTQLESMGGQPLKFFNNG